MQKVAVIGAGIAGLSAGVYARKAGFDVEVFESNTIPGGLCTAWRRRRFVFDGCMHYLVGTRPESPFHRLWEEVGAIQNREIVYPDALATATDRSGRTATLYCDPARLEEHLRTLSPQDAPLTWRLCQLVRALQHVPVPVDKAPELMSLLDGARFLWALRPVAKDWSFCFRTSLAQFAGGFRDPLVRRLLEGTMDPRSPLLNLVSTLANLARQHSGYPIGGSLPFAHAIEARLCALGGKVHYGARVSRVTVQTGRATGLDLADGTHVDADFVIAAGDLRALLDSLLERRFPSPKHERLFQRAILAAPAIQVSFGLSRRYPRSLYAISSMVELAKPVSIPGQSLDWMGWTSHDHDPTMSPPDGSVVSCLIPTQFDVWEQLGHGTPAYKAAKVSIGKSVAEALEGPLPGFSSAVEEVDVATPLTFRRYAGTHHGAYMSWLGTVQRQRIPKTLPGLERLLLAGMWVMPPGGLPGAVKSARDAVQILCKHAGVVFRPGPG